MASPVSYRVATSIDAPAMLATHETDPAVPGDARVAAYLDGQHHPQRALHSRIAYVASADGRIVGYIAGHLTTRNGCDGQVQYLFVNRAYRRQGVGSELLRLLARWFVSQGARRVGGPVANDSPAEAKPFVEHIGAIRLAHHWYGWDDINDVAG